MTILELKTIGYSKHALERFIELLRMHEVTAIADVRSAPYSRLHPDFNREFLQQRLRENGVSYVFLGRELGARPDDPMLYENGRVNYRKLAESARFREGLDRILKEAESHQLALLCAEMEPLGCHRTLLVSRELVALGVSIGHIHADGTLESHDDAMIRLVRMMGMSEVGLYRSREEIIADACARQENRIAYVDEGQQKEESA
jgi:uncharacterized protein (DUF488 family)